MDPDSTASSPLPSDRGASGRALGDHEVGLVEEAIRSGVLNSTRGVFVRRLEEAFAMRLDVARAVACSSGTAAMHAAVASLGLQPGDEVVTTPVTDMGAILPIAYEGAVPAFCDVDPETGNVTAETVRARLTGRTRAIVATHLFGLPCDMGPILELARARGLRVIEDCAQAPLAEDVAGPTGTLGDAAVYSFQQSKHLTTGEGGMLVTSDPALADRARRFVNKGWGYGDDDPDHDVPGLNYRMTELQGAVGFAQVGRLDDVVERRRETAALLAERIADLAGLSTPRVREGVVHAYWRFPLLVDPERVAGGPSRLAAELAEMGVAARPHYLPKPAFACPVFAEWRRFPVLRMAFEAAGTAPDRDPERYPGALAFLSRVLVLPWNEVYGRGHVEAIAAALRACLEGSSR